jgi:hypothetical protein
MSEYVFLNIVPYVYSLQPEGRRGCRETRSGTATIRISDYPIVNTGEKLDKMQVCSPFALRFTSELTS